MSLHESHTVSTVIDGQTYTLETGKLAKFADGSVMVRCGDTMVLVTVVSSKDPKDVDFLPLSVEYREKMSAAGKFPGGFLKREGRPSSKEILVARLIDRPCRPMFPKGWNYDTQIVAQVFSAEPGVDPENIAAVGASAALTISDIPFNGPVSEVRVAKIDGKLLVNPSPEELEMSDIDMTVAGTDASIVMVEGESNEISEEEFLEALDFAHEKIKELNNLQKDLAKKVSREKREVTVKEIPDEILTFVKQTISKQLEEYVQAVTTKDERSAARRELSELALEKAEEKFGENEEYAETLEKYVGQSFSQLEKESMRAMIIKDGKRLDGRTLTDIRPIETEVGYLPRVHGSAIFTRGETQSLTSVTLGTERDEQMVDGLLPTFTSNFFLHYNFPPFSVGETGRFGFTSRREIGHGNLAERALKKLMPKDEEFPYTVRVLSEILESNGSSSMATVCAGSMALMNAGVPLKKPVAGIAMGLIKEDNDVAILSDILGDEDFLGDMDFKVAGTTDGITACQMDIKIEGLSVDIMKTALNQANEGRMHILSKMSETISSANEELSPYAPRFTTFKVDSDQIGAVIGSGGETIRDITKTTNTEINIDDDGLISIAAVNQEDADAAIQMIKEVTAKPEEGKTYTAKVVDVREGLGAICEFMPKKKGLLHISELQWDRTENVADVLKEGEEVEVLLKEITRDGKFRLSRKALLEKPDWYKEKEKERKEKRGNRGGDKRGGDKNRRR